MSQQSYLAVDHEFIELIHSTIASKKSGKVFFFDPNNALDDGEGRILELLHKQPKVGVFLKLDNNKEIRIDRIITLFGKIGPAYDEYDNFANQCMACGPDPD